MAGKFVEPEEAAQMLGITPDELGLMRDRREVYPIRDGGIWKYRRDDIERLVADRAGGLDDLAGEFASPDMPQDSILLSEQELGESGSASSTVIGKIGDALNPESDLKLSGILSPSTINLGDDIKTPKTPPKPGSVSDVRLASQSDIIKAGSSLSAKFEELDALDLDLPSPAESGINLTKPPGGSSKKIKADDLIIADDDFTLGADSGKPGSSKKMSGSAVNLGADDDDFVLGGSGQGSDITHRAGDSGIQLISPADSGLSLEEAPMDLGGSGIEAIDIEDDDMLVLDDGSGDAGAQKGDDDFLLTPLDDATVDESDSGSQVIALDSEVEFDEAAPSALGGRQPSMAAMLEEDMGGGASPLIADAGFGQPAFVTAGSPAFAGAPQVLEAPFSIWNVLGLALGCLLLMMCGMMLYDLMRNMWSWNGTHSVNSSLMGPIVDLFK
jgi:hypothetical protein